MRRLIPPSVAGLGTHHNAEDAAYQEHNERAKAFYRKYGVADVGARTFMVGTDAPTDRIWVRSVPPTIPNSAA